jgi:hypothetical protein
MFRIVFLRLGYSCRTQYHILRNRTRLLSGKIDLSKRWPIACHMQRHFLPIFGLRHLTIPITFRIDPIIDLLRTRLILRLRAITNWKSPTSMSSTHVHGSGFPLKRGKHLIHKVLHVSLLDTQMM